MKNRGKLDELSYHTRFEGIIKLSSCDSSSIVESIKQFNAENTTDLQKTLMLTSDGASGMSGKKERCGKSYV